MAAPAVNDASPSAVAHTAEPSASGMTTARASEDRDAAVGICLPEAQGTAGADGPIPTGTGGPQEKTDEVQANGLQDQTNFLPTRQVIIVFLGLSVALACAFLEQTM